MFVNVKRDNICDIKWTVSPFMKLIKSLLKGNLKTRKVEQVSAKKFVFIYVMSHLFLI